MDEMKPSSVVELVKEAMLPIFDAEKDDLDRIDRWARWSPDDPHMPSQASPEYKMLAEVAQTPWLGLVETSVAQALYVEGYRGSTSENAAPWEIWQKNGMDRRQMAVHRAALRYGQSYVVVSDGENRLGEKLPVLRGVSPRHMVALWGEDLDDDFPMFALRVDPEKDNKRRIRVYDDFAVYELLDDNGKIKYLDTFLHDIGVCPVVRFSNLLDLEGRSNGEVEPFIPVVARINQTTFDRMITQRFSSWIIRTVTGMTEPETEEEGRVAKMMLQQQDLLVAESPDAKFGYLPATELGGFISARDADIRDLAAVSQTPPHHLLGQVSNLSAEALAAAEATLARKVEERRHSFGESWEGVLRLGAHVAGDTTSAQDFESQVRWRDVESRSLAQTADALGKLATMLQVPPQALWERIPGVSDQDVEAWKDMVEDNALDLLMQEIRTGRTSPTEQPGVSGAQPSGADAGTGLQ